MNDKLTAAQLIRASMCEASHQGYYCAQFVEILTGSGKLKYSSDNADLGVWYSGHGLVWALLLGVAVVATSIFNGFWPKFLHDPIGWCSGSGVLSTREKVEFLLIKMSWGRSYPYWPSF
jgi:hypothetical protein